MQVVGLLYHTCTHCMHVCVSASAGVTQVESHAIILHTYTHGHIATCIHQLKADACVMCDFSSRTGFDACLAEPCCTGNLRSRLSQ